ncbi:FMN-dependent NADH-azoreductase [Arthrobacter sp. CAN_C5]|uniref:FMN-dependent NADH-azoreductase n=1 Tax=Arthrobacter sp. CAN_C5 TaxID=2760706 RepID=UPI001AE586A8|nr:NAD(P)H-dependent oxidoreductase [Arthrobacter sp. CAN_C5]MBP2216941.1 FMN-dependent NADH-azoreductase [Arthrobacter sp. CAN_C5]
MTTLLHIDSSARASRPETDARGSHTRRLSERFISRWREAVPDDAVIYRDVALNPPTPVTGDWIAGAFTAPQERSAEMSAVLEESDLLVGELTWADVLVIGAPMYNFGVPSTLKAWVDNIVRVGLTFGFDRSRKGDPYWPMLEPGKHLVILTSRGDYGYGPEGRLEHMNHVDKALATALTYIGVTEITTIAVEYDEFSDTRVEDSLSDALAEIDALVESMTGGSGTASDDRRQTVQVG